MNENISLCNILKDCPKDMKLWSPVWGDVFLKEVDERDTYIVISVCNHFMDVRLYPNGKMFNLGKAECVIFPSQTQRDWSKFKAPIEKFNPREFKPGNIILARRGDNRRWNMDLYLGAVQDKDGNITSVFSYHHKWFQCIPYNDETKHVLDSKSGEVPEFYKWWED